MRQEARDRMRNQATLDLGTTHDAESATYHYEPPWKAPALPRSRTPTPNPGARVRTRANYGSDGGRARGVPPEIEVWQAMPQVD